MRVIIALLLGALGVAFVLAGSKGSGFNLLGGFFGKGYTPPKNTDQYPKVLGNVLGSNTGSGQTQFQTPGGPLGGILPSP